jgi:hypothetical protein
VSEPDNRAYIGREPGCGCCSFVCTAEAARDASTQRAMALILRDGGSIDRIGVEEFRASVAFGCAKRKDATRTDCAMEARKAATAQKRRATREAKRAGAGLFGGAS